QGGLNPLWQSTAEIEEVRLTLQHLELVVVCGVGRSQARILRKIAHHLDSSLKLTREEDAQILRMVRIVVRLLIGPVQRIARRSARRSVDLEGNDIVAAWIVADESIAGEITHAQRSRQMELIGAVAQTVKHQECRLVGRVVIGLETGVVFAAI